MASRDIECTPVPGGPVCQRHDQKDCPDNGHDTSRLKRAKLLRAMCITSVVIIVVSASAVLIGILGFSSYPGGMKYIMCGSVFAGGMVFFFTFCPICMYYEDKTTGETAMGRQYKCCLNCMLVYFAFALCAVLIVLGISGIWGTVECVRAKQKILLSNNMCGENTEARLTIAILTMVTSSLLLTLILVVICIFCYNKKTLGYKDIYEYRREFIEDIRREAREEALREVAGRETQLGQQIGGPGVVPHTANPSAPPLVKVNSEEPPPSYETVVRDVPNMYEFEIGKGSVDIDKP